jgi:hypothetical protein
MQIINQEAHFIVFICSGLDYKPLDPSSRFDYSATVRVQENHPVDGKVLPRLDVVKMTLKFREFLVLHNTQGIQFDQEREVILFPLGKILRVTGDGETEVPVVSI